MKRLMVIQHESYEALGTWDPLLKESALRIKYVNFERTPDATPTLERCDGILLLGGYMGVYEADRYCHLNVEMKLIEAALKREIPIFGICLGSQILAHVLGAHVRKHTEREMGWYDVHLTESGLLDPVLGHFGKSQKVFQSHGDTFDIPRGAEHLAWSKLCDAQAFRYGKHAYGLQFHLEIDRPTVEHWLSMPENIEIFAASSGTYVPEQIARETDRYLDESVRVSVETFRRFLRMAGARAPAVRIGS